MKQIILVTVGSGSAHLLKQVLIERLKRDVVVFHHTELDGIDKYQPVVIVVVSDEKWEVKSIDLTFATIKAQHSNTPKIWVCEEERIPILSELQRNGSIAALINFDQAGAFQLLVKQIVAYL